MIRVCAMGTPPAAYGPILDPSNTLGCKVRSQSMALAAMETWEIDRDASTTYLDRSFPLDSK